MECSFYCNWVSTCRHEISRSCSANSARGFTGSERKSLEYKTNGELAKLSLVEQSKIADHIKAPRASPTVDKKNESGGRYLIPHIAPDIIVEWARKLIVNQPSNFYQMDPLSSPHELSPIHSERTPVVWFTPADMKMFLRPSDEGLEEAWRKATTLLCFTIHILREACEFTDFRKTSFGSTYMALLGCAQTKKIATPWTETSERQGVVMRKSKEGLYVTQTEYKFYLEQWEKMRSRSEVKDQRILQLPTLTQRWWD